MIVKELLNHIEALQHVRPCLTVWYNLQIDALPFPLHLVHRLLDRKLLAGDITRLCHGLNVLIQAHRLELRQRELGIHRLREVLPRILAELDPMPLSHTRIAQRRHQRHHRHELLDLLLHHLCDILQALTPGKRLD